MQDSKTSGRPKFLLNLDASAIVAQDPNLVLVPRNRSSQFFVETFSDLLRTVSGNPDIEMGWKYEGSKEDIKASDKHESYTIWTCSEFIRRKVDDLEFDFKEDAHVPALDEKIYKTGKPGKLIGAEVRLTYDVFEAGKMYSAATSTKLAGMSWVPFGAICKNYDQAKERHLRVLKAILDV